MVDETLGLVRDALASWARADEALMRRVFHPDAILIDHTRPDGLEFRGHDGFLAAYRSWAGAWQTAYAEAAEPTLLAPGLALVMVRLSGTAKASGIPVERQSAVLYWVAGGLVLRAEVFPSEGEAREAVARLR